MGLLLLVPSADIRVFQVRKSRFLSLMSLIKHMRGLVESVESEEDISLEGWVECTVRSTFRGLPDKDLMGFPFLVDLQQYHAGLL